MTLWIRDKIGAEALELQQVIDRFYGFSVVNGGTVSAGADPFDVDVDPATVLVNGTEHSTTSQQVNLESYVSTDDPRKVVLYVDDTGSVSVEAGEPEPPKPETEIRFNTYRPAPPDFWSDTGGTSETKLIGTPLAEIWVGQNTDQITDADIRQRDLPSDLDLAAAAISDLTIDQITDGNNTTHTGELADAADVPSDSDIADAINADSDHGSTAPHNYRTDTEIRTAVEGNVNAADLLGTTPADRFLRVDSDGTTSWAEIPSLEAPLLDEGTVTHTSGGSTTVTVNTTIQNEAQIFSVDFGVNTAISTTYDFDYTWDREWDNTNTRYDLTFTFNWNTDPGQDLDIHWVAYDATPAVVSGRYTDNDAIDAMTGATINPGTVTVQDGLELPQYGDFTNHPGAVEGDIAFNDGSGTAAEGYYGYENGSWVGPFVTDDEQVLSNLSIDVNKDWNNKLIRNLASPQNAADAARKTEVDTVQSNLDTHAGDVDAHHAKYTDEEARDAAGNMAQEGIDYDDANDTLALNVVASGSETLSGGSGTVDTGVAVDDAHYMVPVSPQSGADIAMSLEDDTGGTGNYVLHLEENTSSIGNPTIGWKMLRV